MKKITKGIIFALIYTLVVSLLPQTFSTDVAEAATDLKSVELDNRYYVLDGALYEDTVFLLGGEYLNEDEVGNLKLIAKKGDETKTLIPEEEFPGSYKDYTNIILDGKNKLVVKKSVWNDTLEETYYTINKSTLKVIKQTKAEFYSPFIESLKNYGYSFDDFHLTQEIFGQNGLGWIVFKDHQVDNDENGYSVAVNENGNVFKFETSDLDFISNGQGDLYYYEPFDNKDLVRVLDDGRKQTFALPNNIYFISYIDNDNRIYEHRYTDKHIFKVYQLEEDQEADYIHTLENVSLFEDNKGTMWYKSYTQDNSSYTYGFLDDNLTSHDVLIANVYVGSISTYKNNILYHNHDGYTLLTDSTPQPPSNKEGWVKENNKWSFYYKGKGKHKGWLKNNGKWYFLDESGEMKTGWVKDKGKWYFLNNQGEMATGWKKSGNKWYLLSDDGTMATGWKKSGGKWYLLNDGGEMETGWHKDGSQWYYLESSGAMKQGWLKDGNQWYLLQSSGAMATGWKVVSSKWYYFYSNGSMAANTTIDGYNIGSSGAWIK
jgi:glucan-binding YG repeat protein